MVLPRPSFRAVLVALALAAAPALAQSVQKPGAQPESFSLDDLRKVEKARDEAQARLKALQQRDESASREAADVDADLIAAAADSRRREEAATAAERRLVQLDRDIAEARVRLAGDEAGREDLLAALMSLTGRRPPPLTSSPQEAADAVRAAILMSEAAPALSARAAELKAAIAQLDAATLAARIERDRLAGEEAALVARRAQIEALAGEKRLARASVAVETATLEAETRRLANEAENLRDLLDGLARTAPPKPGVKPPARNAASGARTAATSPAPPLAGSAPPGSGLPVSGAGAAPRPAAASATPVSPAIGRKMRGFGQLVGGERHPGLTLATRGSAQIVAPTDARVEFAGEFRSYGQMLILDVGGDMLVILSGLGSVYPETGQWVLAGEPVGRMSDQNSPDPELYLEVRRQGQPVDPERWLKPKP